MLVVVGRAVECIYAYVVGPVQGTFQLGPLEFDYMFSNVIVMGSMSMLLEFLGLVITFAREVCVEAEAESPASASSSVAHGRPALPCLPANLDDLDRNELKQLLVHHHAAWLRTANQITATASNVPNASNKAVLKKIRKAQRRKANYWKSKAQKDKKELTERYNQLVLESSVYVQSKRRKSNATRRRMTLFGGPGLPKIVLFVFVCYLSIPRFCVPTFEYFEGIFFSHNLAYGVQWRPLSSQRWMLIMFYRFPSRAKGFVTTLLPHDI